MVVDESVLYNMLEFASFFFTLVVIYCKTIKTILGIMVNCLIYISLILILQDKLLILYPTPYTYFSENLI
jgi:hypothetical protein